MKLLSLVCIFTAIAYQPALAQGYAYESMGHSVPEYVEVDGVRYARIPEKKKQVSPSPAWRLNANAQNENKLKRNVLDMGWLSLRPYLGGEGALGRSKYEADLADYLFDKNMRRFGLFAGLQFNQYVSLEAFYNVGKMQDKTVDASSDYTNAVISSALDFDAYGIDLLGYVPIAKKIDIILGLGYGWYDFEGEAKISVYNNTTEWSGSATFSDKVKSEAVRYSLGMQFLLNQNWAFRLLGRYVDFRDDDIIKSMMELSVGLRYLF